MSKTKSTSENGPSFVAEFGLRTTPRDERELRVRFEAARQMYNACLGETLRRLSLMRESKDYRAARARTKGKERRAAFLAVAQTFGYTSLSIQKFAQTCRDACWIGDHLGSHDTQTTSLRAFRAVQQYGFAKRGKPHFKTFGTLDCVEGKSNAAVIRVRANVVYWSGLVLPLVIDPGSDWERQALARRVKYVRILRRSLRSRLRWYVQLVCEGMPPQRKAVALGSGTVGLDIGPSTIAVVSDSTASLQTFCSTLAQPWKTLRRAERALDRSRRATNPRNYDERGVAKKGVTKWIRSKRYAKIATARREIERTLQAERKRAHGELANKTLRCGSIIKTEKLSYRSLQKNFGRSVKVHAPGAFLAGIKRKLDALGGTLVEIETTSTRLSQYDHTTDSYAKKPLSQRMQVFGDGRTEPIQRDLYSAFLARCCDQHVLDVRQAQAAWPGAEPLLRRAASSFSQPASAKGQTLRSAERSSSDRRRSGSPVEEDQNGERGRGRRSDAIAGPRIVRAAESSPKYDLRIPWL